MINIFLENKQRKLNLNIIIKVINNTNKMIDNEQITNKQTKKQTNKQTQKTITITAIKIIIT